jgi:hypothetical protein
MPMRLTSRGFGPFFVLYNPSEIKIEQNIAYDKYK